MTIRKVLPALLFLGIAALCLSAFSSPQWGFFGHRRINKMAVFTLPPDMMVFFKKHIEYLSEHAVDPDKRRYASKHEAVRHYIDIDHWGTYPFDNIPRKQSECLVKFSELVLITERNDSIHLPVNKLFDWPEKEMGKKAKAWQETLSESQIKALKRRYSDLFLHQAFFKYYEDEWTVPLDSLKVLEEWVKIPRCKKAVFIDRFSPYGILPYHLVSMQKRITKVFGEKDPKKLLRLLADYGHYVGDAHVPLHTTENYNGQLTDQIGIHAFWESRIPELFADKDYDYFVGKAEYIDNVSDYVWDIVLSSHALLDSVLLIEKDLRNSFPRDQQFCFEERFDLTIKTQCKAFAAEYQRRMNGMVEQRMRDAILALGSLWYTAWIDAGQPDLRRFVGEETVLVDEEEQKALDNIFRSGESKGRGHDQ